MAGIVAAAAPSVTLSELPSVEERIAIWLKQARPTTSAAYTGDLGRFSTWLGEASPGAGLSRLLSLPRAHALHVLEQYQAHLRDSGRAPATVNRAISAVNAALKEAAKADVGPGVLPVKSLKVRAYRDTKGPGLSRTTQLVNQIQADSREVSARDLAIVLLLAQRGLRRAEVAGLGVSDVDLENNRIRVRRKGADAADWLSISTTTVRALGDWLGIRHGFAGPGVDALFVVATNRNRGAAMSGDAIYRVVRARAQKIGANIRPHGLRHGAITELIVRSNGNVAMAQAFAGHANPSTTTRYIDNLNDLAGQGVRMLGDVF